LYWGIAYPVLRQRRRANILRSGGVVVLNPFSNFTDIVRKQIAPARLLASLRKPRFPQAGLLLFQHSGPHGRLVSSAVGDGFVYSNEVSETRHRRATAGTTGKVLPTILTGTSQRWKNKDGPVLYLHHHCKHRAGAGHGLPCHSLLKRADPVPMRRSHDGGRKDYIPTTSRTRRTSARAFIHGGLAALRSRHLSS
jgi:hypothetical protein